MDSPAGQWASDEAHPSHPRNRGGRAAVDNDEMARTQHTDGQTGGRTDGQTDKQAKAQTDGTRHGVVEWKVLFIMTSDDYKPTTAIRDRKGEEGQAGLFPLSGSQRMDGNRLPRPSHLTTRWCLPMTRGEADRERGRRGERREERQMPADTGI